tara:strand:- start:2924 stop:3418 length:495 start_codon:yes stop_codon:yes gene_type:complete
MVFTKLTDEQKQQLFELKETLPSSTISSMRALIMRGASVEDAQKLVADREKAKKEYLDQLDKEIESMKGKKVQAKGNTPEETKAEPEPKKKKASKKAEPTPAPPPTPEPAPKPKAKRAPKKVAVEEASVKEPVMETIMETEEPPKPKKGRGRHPIESNVISIAV